MAVHLFCCRPCYFQLGRQNSLTYLPPYGAKLTALTKRCGGVRPVAIGCTLRRLASKCSCLHALDTVPQILAPLEQLLELKQLFTLAEFTSSICHLTKLWSRRTSVCLQQHPPGQAAESCQRPHPQLSPIRIFNIQLTFHSHVRRCPIAVSWGHPVRRSIRTHAVLLGHSQAHIQPFIWILCFLPWWRRHWWKLWRSPGWFRESWGPRENPRATPKCGEFRTDFSLPICCKYSIRSAFSGLQFVHGYCKDSRLRTVVPMGACASFRAW